MSTATLRNGRSTARASSQRNRVLEAARKCFIDSGFHAASMADIAATADMSVGLIYRYFANKSAIVKAIIDHHLEQGECELVSGLRSPADIAHAVIGALDCWSGDGDGRVNAALFLEITAESTRDADIAAAVRKADEFMQKSLAEALRRCARTGGVHLDAAAVRGRVQVLQCLIEGLAVRCIREPELKRAALQSAVEQCVRSLMAPARPVVARG